MDKNTPKYAYNPMYAKLLSPSATDATMFQQMFAHIIVVCLKDLEVNPETL